jgi:hypothetical protein
MFAIHDAPTVALTRSRMPARGFTIAEHPHADSPVV